MKWEPDEQTRNLIEAVVAEHLDGHDIEPCNIAIDVDDEGHESIEVGLCYKLSASPVDPAKSLDMLSAIRDALVAAGDWRVPYVEHYFDDKQEIKGMRRAC